MKLAVLFDHFGPYHLARLGAAAGFFRVTGIEFSTLSKDYAWNRCEHGDLKIISMRTSNAAGSDNGINVPFRERLNTTLSQLNPDVVAIPGWSSKEALVALHWCMNRGVPSIMMSESNAHDEPRVEWKEWIKKSIVACSSSALVGGSSHRQYLHCLGMPGSQIALGYDAVDNDFFNRRSINIQETSPGNSTGSFLASARFIEKKNLLRLLEAYKVYRTRGTADGNSSSLWNLTILGDGPLRENLEHQVSELALGSFVSLPGFLQYDELPDYYAKASAFIHASTTEQWGLVVNEAMASGLPVMVSNRCGCANDLVVDGANGFVFDPYDTQSIADCLTLMASLTEAKLAEMGRRSRELIQPWGPERFGEGMKVAVEAAIRVGPKRPSFISRAVVGLLSLR
ncbi:glycosyltransferase family 4 protein [Phragmitibacter flavus]|uniref:Glycosyltransferase family 4 protein n=1 Tax=Phragmitibacter flavus TaxID=2576071 RepID=A0A5R8KCC1_9BACT|nr:glycosyltransferase family 4 protein [Phragmitibacter flavus]TLD69941.1 glycosyltransferase family 4 protein [Phragmitibacter flavus]